MDWSNRLLAEPWRRADSGLAAALIAIAALVIVEANRLPPPFFDPLGSAAVPRAVAGLLIVLAGMVVLKCLRTPVPSNPASKSTDTASAPMVALGATLLPIVYVGSMHLGLLGFGPASALFVWLLGATLSRGKWLTFVLLVPIALVAGFGLNALLTEFFYIDLPQRSFWMAA